MKLKSLYIDGFGKFEKRSLEFGDGFNVIYGHNEAGKSTMHSFIKAMLFGLSKRRSFPDGGDEYERFEPWGGGGFGGSLELLSGGNTVRIKRDFKKSPEDIELTVGEDTFYGEEAEKLLRELLSGLTEKAYRNTISIGQLKAQTEKGAHKELSSLIKNISGTGSGELSYDAAIEYLDRKKRAFEEQIDEEAAAGYSRRIGRIRNLERELSDPKYDNRLPEYEEIGEGLKEKLSALSGEKEKLSLRIEKAEGTLSENGFSDLRSIDEYEKEAQSCYDEYRRLEKTAKGLKRIILPLILLIAGLGIAALSGRLLYLACTSEGGFREALAYAFGKAFKAGLCGAALAGLSAVLSVSAAVVFVSGKRKLSGFERAEKRLLEIFDAHIGDTDVSSEALCGLKERLEEFRRLQRASEDCRAELSEINDELLKLHEDRETFKEKLDREELLRREAESKLMELNSLKAEVSELRRVLDTNSALKEKVTAVELAEEKLLELSQKIKSSVGIHLNRTASGLISEITGGAYKSIDSSDDSRIYLSTGRKLVPCDKVSAGTMDQIYLAVRLSAVKLMEGEKEIFPLIFDDSFALYDDDRLKRVLAALGGFSKGEKRQLIAFTCHGREAEFLREAGVSFKLIAL